jgi:GAF domain-containing protein
MNLSSVSLIRKYRSSSPQNQALFSGFLVVIPAITSSIISYYVRQYFEGNFRIELVIILVMYLLIVAGIRYMSIKAELLDAVATQQRNAMSQTVPCLDDIIAKRLHRLHDSYNKYRSLGSAYAADLFQVTVASTEHIQSLVEELHKVVETQFGGSFDAPIDFEVTFMTKSYVDGKITIYAYQNRDRRAPPSLLLREHDPDLYERGTETSKIYQMVKPEMRIISNTFVGMPDEVHGEYQSLYTGQLDRIKSSIIYPVLSDSNQLLGTVVVHCFGTREELPYFSHQE